jgi:hypothetical protein
VIASLIVQSWHPVFYMVQIKQTTAKNWPTVCFRLWSDYQKIHKGIIDYLTESIKSLLPRLWLIVQSPLAYPAEAAAICKGHTNKGENCQHSPSCFLRELRQVCDPFFCSSGSLCSGCETLAYRSWQRRRVVAKSAGAGDPVFTSMDALLYGP